MVESQECVAILYGVDGLILDTFAQYGRILDGAFDKDQFMSGSYVVWRLPPGRRNISLRRKRC